MSDIIYYNKWDFIKKSPYFLYIVIGGRGIGKTYNVLRGLITDGEFFLYVRRNEAEVRNCCTVHNNPFLTINADLDRTIEVSKAEDSFIIHEDDSILGVAGSLSTFGKYRGSNFDRVNYVIFDEFLATSPFDRLYKHESELFFNMLETVGRNREIQGRPPIKVIMLANSNRIRSGIIESLRLGEQIRLMKINKIEEWADDKRGIYINLPEDLEITRLKKQTKLYKLSADSEYYDMAINNNFAFDDFASVNRYRSNELVPVCGFGSITFYTVKGRDYLYCSTRRANVKSYDNKTINEFRRRYGLYIKGYLDRNKVQYSDYDTKLFVDTMFKIS